MKNKLFYYLGKRVGYAIGDFGLIEEGDRILVAVSGGKDSLCLIDFLLDKQRRSPVKFELFAYHVVINEEAADMVREFLNDREVDYEIDYTAMAELELEGAKKDKCFLCSWYRRKAIFLAAGRFNCNKVAFGHNMDDVVQTLLMNMFFQASISTMCPKQVFFDGEVTVIRPLVYLREHELQRLAKQLNYPEIPSCPWARENNRLWVGEAIKKIEQTNPKVNVVKNIFLSLFNINSEYLPKRLS